MHWYRQERADNDEWHDQNADTQLVAHGYWSLCLAEDRQQWRLVLLEQNESLDEVIAEHCERLFDTEADAKRFAADCEQRGEIGAGTS
ncbi:MULTISPECIES: hypothetical protein [Mycolicibacter]|uniref:Uncharacterized protein n=2 Tax=Mycolicibacter TaxID=1073531 RepID=A0ABU5XL85_9MYCO|nr:MULTISPECIES: hypothetical protein [unclassified Mycolicibacter]MEB3023040.1 hypothetical protein [Mycolicibacter sp. MYC098]MEB3033550.1 hypothetical protein [Mycolicibacter sp. MYC340]